MNKIDLSESPVSMTALAGREFLSLIYLTPGREPCEESLSVVSINDSQGVLLL